MPMPPIRPREPATVRLANDGDAAMTRWRAAHPAATLAEIEQAVDWRLSADRAAVITATATASVCGECNRPFQRVGTRSRQVRTAQEGELRFTEPAWRCPGCGAGVPP